MHEHVHRPRQMRWTGWLVLLAAAGFTVLGHFLLLVICCCVLWLIPEARYWALLQGLKLQLRQRLEVPAKPSLPAEATAKLQTNAPALRSSASLFCPTNVWDVHVRFTPAQWAALGPNSAPPILGFMKPDGSIILRNPDTKRAGLAGVLGVELPWSEADLEFGGARFRRVGARFKGNGTFITSTRTYKRPLKFDLNRHVKSQELAGRTTLNFHNLVADGSCLSDTLAYEFFRDAGVPASRTTYARLKLTIDDRFEQRLLGLYVVVENPDGEWGKEQFGVEGVALFKPVTYELFQDLGDDWAAYKDIYAPKTKTDSKQRRRLIDLARLVTHADDAAFAARIGEFIDLAEFARYFACEAILANYDGILSNGQNFLLYLDPRTERFGFIPWDLDHCWGEFPVGTATQRERASIWHPWVGENRFLERMFRVGAFRERYEEELRQLRKTLFVPDRLNRRLNELASVLRPFVAEESTRRLARFEQAISDKPPNAASEPPRSGPNERGFPLKRFFAARASSVTEQLEGRAKGEILHRNPRP